MATASATVAPGYPLVGTTPDPASAPITYSFRGISVTEAQLLSATVSSGTFFGDPNPVPTLVIGSSSVIIFPPNTPASVLAGLPAAINSIKSQISTQVVTTTPPAPASAPAPSPTPRPKAPTSFDQPPPPPPPQAVGGRDPLPLSDSLLNAPPISTTVNPGPVTIDLPEFDEEGNFTGNRRVTLEVPPTPDDNESLGVRLSDEELAEFAADIAAQNAEISEQIAAAAIENEIVVEGARPKDRADWRVRLSLSDDPSVNYLYKAPDPGILNPLNATNGVVFPYTPTISVNYSATYNPTELVHSNYKVYQYSSSSIDSITITSDFTAQDEYEANYLLAVIHFFRSATKMFYGQDENPRRGTPPPLCYIYGMGSYQFAGQPLAIQQFSYNLPNNVDYIKTSVGGQETVPALRQPNRLEGTGASSGGVLPPPNFTSLAEPDTVSWVPSKIQISVTCVPMMNRNSVSNIFSFEEYATGRLLNGIGKRSGGFW
jgi:hypothetical protein